MLRISRGRPRLGGPPAALSDARGIQRRKRVRDRGPRPRRKGAAVAGVEPAFRPSHVGCPAASRRAGRTGLWCPSVDSFKLQPCDHTQAYCVCLCACERDLRLETILPRAGRTGLMDQPCPEWTSLAPHGPALPRMGRMERAYSKPGARLEWTTDHRSAPHNSAPPSLRHALIAPAS
jgi:hypothetical protein